MRGFVLFWCLNYGFDIFNILYYAIHSKCMDDMHAWCPFENCNLYKLINSLFGVCEHNYLYALQIKLGGLKFISYLNLIQLVQMFEG